MATLHLIKPLISLYETFSKLSVKSEKTESFEPYSEYEDENKKMSPVKSHESPYELEMEMLSVEFTQTIIQKFGYNCFMNEFLKYYIIALTLKVKKMGEQN